jgi:hypothetical protein
VGAVDAGAADADAHLEPADVAAEVVEVVEVAEAVVIPEN